MQTKLITDQEKMELAGFKAVALAGLCISFAIKLRRDMSVIPNPVARCWRTVVRDLLFVFPRGGFEVPFGLSNGARIIVLVMEFSL